VDPDAVPDKDGISALARLLILAVGLKAAGGGIAERLDEIARRYGVYETDQLSIRVDDTKIIAAVMSRLRAHPPTTLAGQQVSVVDLAHGTEQLPATDALLISGETIKVVVRPSGTEPKLKCYLEARSPALGAGDLDAARATTRGTLTEIRSEMSAALGLTTTGTV
jgi:phosphomannomutase